MSSYKGCVKTSRLGNPILDRLYALSLGQTVVDSLLGNVIIDLKFCAIKCQT